MAQVAASCDPRQPWCRRAGSGWEGRTGMLSTLFGKLGDRFRCRCGPPSGAHRQRDRPVDHDRGGRHGGPEIGPDVVIRNVDEPQRPQVVHLCLVRDEVLPLHTLADRSSLGRHDRLVGRDQYEGIGNSLTLRLSCLWMKASGFLTLSGTRRPTSIT